MDNNTPDLSGMFEMLTKNPEMLKKASEMLSGMSGGRSQSDGTPAETPNVDRRGAREDNRGEKLLDALKPYLSPSRRRAVDSIKQFGKMEEIIKLLNLKGGGDNV